MLEIELKVWVQDFEALRARLLAWSGKELPYVKKDVYYTSDKEEATGKINHFRLRNENEKWFVTSKIKTISEGIEVSHEREFEIFDAPQFHLFAADLGYFPYINKSKLGYSFEKNGIKAELSHVESLGDFLELEILMPGNTSEKDIQEQRKRLLKVLAELGCHLKDLEPKAYTQLLLETV